MTDVLFAPAINAALYSNVGQADGAGDVASMGLARIALEIIKSSAPALNIDCSSLLPRYDAACLADKPRGLYTTLAYEILRRAVT